MNKKTLKLGTMIMLASIAMLTVPTTIKAEDGGHWVEENGGKYWYENGVKQGTEGRGKEIFDPGSDAWYWLDAVDGGKMATSKDLYQESDAGEWCEVEETRTGKWVRYDAEGHMIKGWSTGQGADAKKISGPEAAKAGEAVYYFDEQFGSMVKGYCTIGTTEYYFNTATGVLEREIGQAKEFGWNTVEGKEIWYEDYVRQGYSIDGSYRGKEICDPATNDWYWLDNVDGGKKAVSKDVYQVSKAGDWGDDTNANGEKVGKWVRYDAKGHMIKGWCEGSKATAKTIDSPDKAIDKANIYYFDTVYGTMAKGDVEIAGKKYVFNTQNGILVSSETADDSKNDDDDQGNQGDDSKKRG